MKNLIKLFSIVMLLFSTMSFAQMGEEGCILLPKPLKDLIKNPIPKSNIPTEFQDDLDSEKMISYLNAFNRAFNEYQTQQVPKEFVEMIDGISEQHKHFATSLVNSSSDFESLKRNITNQLSSAETLDEAEGLILFNYQIQLVESSKVFQDGNNSLSWPCLGVTMGSAGTSVMSNPYDSADDYGNSGGGIAGGGCTPVFYPFPPKFCK